MLSLPDFRHKQILFIRAEKDMDAKIKFHNENIAYAEEGNIDNQLSVHKVFCLFILGDCSITTKLIQNCIKYGVSVVFLKNNFEAYAVIGSSAEGNYLLRQKQYSQSGEGNFGIAKMIIKNKVSNQMILLKENNRELDMAPIKCCMEMIDCAREEKELLGIEGSASKFFFNNYFLEMDWYRRSPRAKVDINNVLLDIGYTFLFNFIDALLRLYGFDTYRGCYHKLFFQRKSLACDIMEPFRCLIDRQILKSYHLKQIDKNDFTLFQGRYELSYEKQKKYAELFLLCLMERKEDLYNFVKSFYYYILKPDQDFPIFDVK